ncbi:hypothetical protein D3P06_17395 [Paracoccus aestuarii]|uniref:Uncharacterized protein n=1 Tax=Paracoccus aestuarii TaxID=453842 RepID=A0A418ZPQ1_9RHOB|nr:hypothetical protein [Paracoccus aestuarii]RJK96641.1 hypothetical protein D3P06_17395 [Paracoccus aestuarii]WCQ98802.1 hypothetical protein JHW48_13155 [Paracoccus aestuarii]
MVKLAGSLICVVVPKPDIGGCRLCEALLTFGMERSIFVAQVVNVLRATKAVAEAKSTQWKALSALGILDGDGVGRNLMNHMADITEERVQRANEIPPTMHLSALGRSDERIDQAKQAVAVQARPQRLGMILVHPRGEFEEPGPQRAPRIYQLKPVSQSLLQHITKDLVTLLRREWRE